MQEFYAAIHRIVGGLMYAKNFDIALYDDERRAINFPFQVDEVDTDITDPEAWEENPRRGPRSWHHGRRAAHRGTAPGDS